jgi:hypothetical protein
MKLTRENRSTWGKTCPSATLFTTNPAWTEPGSNPGLHIFEVTSFPAVMPRNRIIDARSFELTSSFIWDA